MNYKKVILGLVVVLLLVTSVTGCIACQQGNNVPTATPTPTATPEPTIAATATPTPTATPEPTIAATATPQPADNWVTATVVNKGNPPATADLIPVGLSNVSGPYEQQGFGTFVNSTDHTTVALVNRGLWEQLNIGDRVVIEKPQRFPVVIRRKV